MLRADLDKYFEICKKREWDKFNFNADVEPYFKILMSAVYDAYHPDEGQRKIYGLSMWDKHLKIDPVPISIKLKYGAVDLYDFYRAIFLCLVMDNNYLEDQLVADQIKYYVLRNKIIFSSYIENPVVPALLKESVTDFFGDLNLTEDDTINALKFDLEYRDTALKEYELCRRAAKKLDNIFSLEKGTCQVGRDSEYQLAEINFTLDKQRHSEQATDKMKEICMVLKGAGLNAVFNNVVDDLNDNYNANSMIKCHGPNSISILEPLGRLIFSLDEIRDSSVKAYINTIMTSGSPIHVGDKEEDKACENDAVTQFHKMRQPN